MKNIIIEIGKKFLCIFFVFPIKNNRIFFSAYSGRQYSCNPKYISDWIEQNYKDEFEIIWAFNEPDAFSYLKNRNIKCVKFKSIKYLYYLLTSKIVIDKELAKYYIPRGYGIPLGGSFTIAYYIMTVGILIMFTNIFTGKKYKKNILSMILIVLAMIAEGRRGELLAVIVALFFLFLLSKDTTHFFIKIGIIIVLVLIISTSYKVLLEYMKVIPFFSRYVKSIEGIMIGSDITSGRTELWKSAWDIFKENPIFGIGFGGFAYHISGTFRSIHGQDVMDVHNCTLQLLCENGILGTVIILLPMIFLFSKAYHRITITKKRVNINRYYEYAYKLDSIALGIQIFFLVLSQLDPAFYKPVFWGFYGVSIIFMCGSKKFMYLGKQKQMEIKKG